MEDNAARITLHVRITNELSQTRRLDDDVQSQLDEIKDRLVGLGGAGPRALEIFSRAALCALDFGVVLITDVLLHRRV